MGMAAKKLEKTQEPPTSPNDLIPFTFRLPMWIIQALDEWVEAANQKLGPAKVNRSDLMRHALMRAVGERPNYTIDPTPDAPMAGLRGFSGFFIAHEPIQGQAPAVREFKNPENHKERLRGRLVFAVYQTVAEDPEGK